MAEVEVLLLWRFLLVNHVVFTVRKHRKAKCREDSHKDNLKITLCVTWRGSIKGRVLFGAIARRRVHRKFIKKGVNQKVSVDKKKSFYSFKPEVKQFVRCCNSFTLQVMVRINLFCLGQKCSDLYKFKFSFVFPFKLSNLKIFKRALLTHPVCVWPLLTVSGANSVCSATLSLSGCLELWSNTRWQNV